MDFATYVRQKEDRARAARIGRLLTMDRRRTDPPLLAIGNNWTRAHFDGSFWLSSAPAGLPSLSLVFVQSREGNTGADNPADLGGGDIDLHLIYEGLSRVAADAVLAGATTAIGSVFFSVWHPEIVELRRALGLPRHPAQIVMSGRGNLDIDNTLLFNVPQVPVFVLAGPECRERCANPLSSRPWVTMIPTNDDGLDSALRELWKRGIGRVSCVGGRSLATSLLDAGVVQDVYLTTTDTSAGEPETPFYVGRRKPALDLVVRKRTAPGDTPQLEFEHFAAHFGAM